MALEDICAYNFDDEFNELFRDIELEDSSDTVA